MTKKVCQSCGNTHIASGEAILISYIASALALLYPLANSAKSNVGSALTLPWLDIPVLTAIVILTWLLSGYVNGREQHSSHALCAINSLGFPGLLLVILMAAKG